jgi:hypothetical protein
MRTVAVSLSMTFVMAALAPCAANARSVKQPLRPTGVEANAQGVAVASIHAKAKRGQFRVSGRHLKPGTTFGISVAGVRIGTLTTNGNGSGVARFSSSPHGTTQFLGVDPRGKLVEVSDDQGEDVLENEMPDDTEDQGDVQCCLTDGDGTECEETTADECMAEGGTNMGAGSCFPNPCPTTQPSPDIQCCVPDDDGPECEEESAAECSAAGGVNMGSGSCDPNPCAPTPPPGIVSCCISQGDQGEQQGQPQTEPPECERLTAADCSDEGGTVSSAASCAPNPCVASPTGAFLN